MRSPIRLALFVLALTTPALAHDGHIHKRLFGTVVSVSEQRIEIADRDGKDHGIRVTKQTRVLRGSASVPLEEARAGERVVVGVSSDKPPYTAVEIRLADGAGDTPQAAPR
jgi:hypothetical protein